MCTHRLRIPALLAALLTMLAGPAAAQHGSPKLDLALQRAVEAQDARTERVIVSARSGAAATLRESLVSRGYLLRGDHPSIGAFTIDVPVADLEALAANVDVAGLSSDAIVRPTGALAGGSWPAADSSFLRSTLGLSPSSPLGFGVGVAIIDSGIQPSVDFLGRIAAFYDLSHGDVRRALPYDDYGHGTHVAGLIGGNGLASGLQYQGVAPGVRLLVFKVLDAGGEGRTSDVVRAIEFIAANRRTLGVDVINLSLGHPIFEPAATDPLVQAIEKASRAGLVIVAAAGNFGLNPTTGQPGYAGITSPGNAPSAITVGALQTQGPSRGRTIAWRRSARAGRRGTTPMRSRTFSPPATGSSPTPRRAARCSTPIRRSGSPARLAATTCA